MILSNKRDNAYTSEFSRKNNRMIHQFIVKYNINQIVEYFNQTVSEYYITKK